MKSLLKFLENRFGDINKLSDNASKRIIVTDTLNQLDLIELFENRAAAIHVKQYLDDSSRELTLSQLNTPELKEMRQNWSISHQNRNQTRSDVDSIGMPFNVALSNGQEGKDRYFQSSQAVTRCLRRIQKSFEISKNLNSNLTSPIDKIRLNLDEVSKDGCIMSTDALTGRKFSSGIFRIMKSGFTSSNRGFIHVDDLNVLNDSKGLFSYNLYLQQPDIGGEINIWPISIRSRWDFYCNASILSLLLVQDKEAQDFLYEILPPPTTVKVKEGDLIIINTQRPHAVKKPLIGKKERISLQGFIQYEKGKPLLLEV